MSVDRGRLADALPGYEIGELIGRGAWGDVVGGVHRALGRPVAIKVLGEAHLLDPSVRLRFGSEARVLAGLDHPHIVRIFDFLERPDLCLFVMELLPGGTLRERFAREGLTQDTACSLGIAACSALDYAHARGVLHRDIKPENLMFGDAGRLRLTDFGIAKVLGGSGTSATRAGEIIGTAAYMAPEQVLGHEVTPATDVYAMGTVMYELLSGQLPFPLDGNTLALLYRHVHEQPREILEVAPLVPEGMARSVMACLATEPSRRYQTAADLGVALTDAALEAWGPGWIDRAGVEVVAHGAIGGHISASRQRPEPARRAPAVLTMPSFAPHQPAAAPVTGSPPRWGRRRTAVAAIAAAGVLAAAVALAVTHRGSGAGGGASGQGTVAPGTPRAAASGTASPATGSPPVPAGRLVYSDPMTDSTSGWTADPGQGDTGAAAYRADGYHLTDLRPQGNPLNTFSAGAPFAIRLTAMVVSAHALLSGGPADGAGVRCDQGRGRTGLRYTFEVHGDGSWVVFRIDDKGPAALLQGRSPAGRPAGQENTITGSCLEVPAGTRLAMALGGTSLGAVTDPHPPGAVSWHAAVVVYRDPSSPGTDARFTDVEVRDAGG